MKTFTSIVALIFMTGIPGIINAQTTFQKTYGGPGTYMGLSYVTNANDGGYAAAGFTETYGAGGADIYLVRTNANGDLLWSKTFGGSGNEKPNAIQQTTDNGFIIVGYTTSFGAGTRDVYLIRTDDNGDTLWTRTFGKETEETGWDVKQTSDGGFMVVGDWGTSSYTYLIKTDGNGDLLWTKIFDAGKAFSVHQQSDGGFIIGGGFYNNGQDYFLLRTDSVGSPTWHNSYGGPGTEFIGKINHTPDGGYLLAGSSTSFGAHMMAYLVKTDSSGSVSWSKSYGDGTRDIYCTSAISTDDGYLLLCYVIFGSNYYGLLIKIDNDGIVQWSNNLTSGLNGAVQQTADGGYIISSGPNDCYLTKTDNNGITECTGSVAAVVDSAVVSLVDPFNPAELGSTIVGSPATQVSSVDTANTICTNVGVTDIYDGNAIHISPNPFTRSFGISGTHIGNATITDITGKEIMTLMSKYDYTNVDAENLLPGIYILHYVEGNRQMNVKLVKF